MAPLLLYFLKMKMKILFRAYFHQKKFQKKVARKFIRVRIQIWNRIWTFSKVGSGSGQKSSGSATLEWSNCLCYQVLAGVCDSQGGDQLYSTSEIPVMYNGSAVFVNPISYVINMCGSVVKCNEIAPPRFSIGGKWYCLIEGRGLSECHKLLSLPLSPVQIDQDPPQQWGLGRSIYSPKQLEAFFAFQQASVVRAAYITDASKLSFMGLARLRLCQGHHCGLGRLWLHPPVPIFGSYQHDNYPGCNS
jgi:hypothetical protein